MLINNLKLLQANITFLASQKDTHSKAKLECLRDTRDFMLSCLG
jgi:hypothetical protein